MSKQELKSCILTFALPKGRILKQAQPLLAAAGIDLSPLLNNPGDRRLLIDLPMLGSKERVRILLVKPIDVPTYVERGIADLGIAGFDTLIEANRDLYEPIDLEIGKCRLAVAQPKGAILSGREGRLKIATKYPRSSLVHFRSKGIHVDIIPLFGSVELGPITGLADQIVDLVESGETLRQNNLEEVETIYEVSARLIVHPASLKLKRKVISSVIEAIADAVGKNR